MKRRWKPYCKRVGDIDSVSVFVRMSHVAIDVGKYAVATPRCCEVLALKAADKTRSKLTHEQTEAQRDRAPVLREQVCLCGLAQGAGLMRLDKAINKHGKNNFVDLSVIGTVQVDTRLTS